MFYEPKAIYVTLSRICADQIINKKNLVCATFEYTVNRMAAALALLKLPVILLIFSASTRLIYTLQFAQLALPYIASKVVQKSNSCVSNPV